MMRGIWSSYVSASPYAKGVDFEEAVDSAIELAADLFRLGTELLVDPEDELQGLARRGRGNVDKRFGRNAKRRCDSFHLIFPRRPVSEFVVPYRRIRQTTLLREIALGKTPGPPARADAA